MIFGPDESHEGLNMIQLIGALEVTVVRKVSTRIRESTGD